MTEQYPEGSLDQVRDGIRLKHCCIRTEEAAQPKPSQET